MILRSVESERLWDSWLFQWEGTVHLFYLASQGPNGRIGHATSNDLIHWRRNPDIIPPHWPFTGMVIRHEEKFYMFLGQVIDDQQTTMLYESDDLDNWKPTSTSPVAKPQSPYYRESYDPWGHSVAWRDPYVFYDETDQYYHMLICATAPEQTAADTGARIGHCRSRDLIHWETLPPIDAPTNAFYHVEVPEHFYLNGTHYIIFSTGSVQGIRLNTPCRRETVGTYYMISDNFEGPYHLPENPLLLGAGYHRMASYVGRKFDFKNTPILYSQVREDSPEFKAVWATPKRIVQNENAELELHYWDELDTLKTNQSPHCIENIPPLQNTDIWSIENTTLVGTSPVMSNRCLLASDRKDFHLNCNVKMESGHRCGMVLRSKDKHGILISMDYELQKIEVGTGRYHPALGWGADISRFALHDDERMQKYILDDCKFNLQKKQSYNLRIMMRDRYFEAYIDNRWIFTLVFNDAAAQGDIDFFVEHGKALLSELSIENIEPLVESSSDQETQINI